MKEVLWVAGLFLGYVILPLLSGTGIMKVIPGPLGGIAGGLTAIYMMYLKAMADDRESRCAP